MHWLGDLLTGLAPRERLLIVAALGLTLAAALFLMVIKPQQQALRQAEQRLQDQRSLLRWLEAQAQEADRLRASGAQRALGPVPVGIVEVEASLADASLRNGLARLSPLDGGKIELRLEEVSFVGLNQWLAKTGLAPHVFTLAVEATDQPDTVNVDLVAGLAGRRQ